MRRGFVSRWHAQFSSRSHLSAMMWRTLFFFAAMVRQSEENLLPRGARRVWDVGLDSISILISACGLWRRSCWGVMLEEELAETEGAMGVHEGAAAGERCCWGLCVPSGK